MNWRPSQIALLHPRDHGNYKIRIVYGGGMRTKVRCGRRRWSAGSGGLVQLSFVSSWWWWESFRGGYSVGEKGQLWFWWRKWRSQILRVQSICQMCHCIHPKKHNEERQLNYYCTITLFIIIACGFVLSALRNSSELFLNCFRWKS